MLCGDKGELLQGLKFFFLIFDEVGRAGNYSFEISGSPFFALV